METKYRVSQKTLNKVSQLMIWCDLNYDGNMTSIFYKCKSNYNEGCSTFFSGHPAVEKEPIRIVKKEKEDGGEATVGI